MRKISQAFIAAFFVTSGILTYVWNSSNVFGGDNLLVAAKVRHTSKATPTRALMDLISSHTSKILDGIMVGDFHAVAREAHEVADNSEIVMEMFFSADGKAGDWFFGDAKTEAEMKVEFEKYLNIVIDSSRNIAETAGITKNIVETYKSFDEMLQKSCFACHAATRDLWPDWTDPRHW